MSREGSVNPEYAYRLGNVQRVSETEMLRALETQLRCIHLC